MRVAREPIRIKVEMEVTRYQEFGEDSLVQVWGFVGDYEVSIWLSRDDERVRGLRERK